MGLTLTAIGVTSLTPELARTLGQVDELRSEEIDFAISVDPAPQSSSAAHAPPAAAPTAPPASPSRAATTLAIPPPIAKPTPAPDIPRRIIIPSIQLDAPIAPVELKRRRGDPAAQWGVPDGQAAGWHNTSARLGETGNLVLNGHHNINGKVFARLKDLKPYDEIIITGDHLTATYLVTERKLLLEQGQPLAVRLQHAQFIAPTSDTRLTLVTCWPPEDYTYRLILVARPISNAMPTGKMS